MKTHNTVRFPKPKVSDITRKRLITIPWSVLPDSIGTMPVCNIFKLSGPSGLHVNVILGLKKKNYSMLWSICLSSLEHDSSRYSISYLAQATTSQASNELLRIFPTFCFHWLNINTTRAKMSRSFNSVLLTHFHYSQVSKPCLTSVIPHFSFCAVLYPCSTLIWIREFKKRRSFFFFHCNFSPLSALIRFGMKGFEQSTYLVSQWRNTCT